MTGHLITTILAADITPPEATSGSITGYLLGYGPIGIFLVALAWLMFKGWRLTSPAEEAASRKEAREEGRADLCAELERANARADRAEAKYDAVIENIQPLLSSFVTVTGTLNPILQDLVRYGLQPARNRRRGDE